MKTDNLYLKDIGTIQADGSVHTVTGRKFYLHMRGIGEDGFPIVLLDATLIGGTGCFHRKSVKEFVGKNAKFDIINGVGCNFVVLPDAPDSFKDAQKSYNIGRTFGD